MNKKYGIIYCVLNSINNKCYIGQTTRKLSKRKSEHEWEAENGRDKTHFHKAIKKYGIDNFIWEVIYESETEDDLNKMESHFIVENKTAHPFGYNLTTGGSFGKHNQRTKNILKEKGKQRKHSNETKRKIGEGNKGKITSEETKKKISLSLIGHKHTEQAKEKMKGHKRTEEGKRNISISLKGRILTKEHRENISKSRRMEKISINNGGLA